MYIHQSALPALYACITHAWWRGQALDVSCDLNLINAQKCYQNYCSCRLLCGALCAYLRQLFFRYSKPIARLFHDRGAARNRLHNGCVLRCYRLGIRMIPAAGALAWAHTRFYINYSEVRVLFKPVMTPSNQSNSSTVRLPLC